MKQSDATAYKTELLTQTLLRDLERLETFARKILSLQKEYQIENPLPQDFPKQIQAIAKHLKNGSLTIALVGEFKRGKSTFVNALIGQEILPADVIPTTAVATRLIYRDTPGVTLRFHDGYTREIELAQLTDFVTKRTQKTEAAAGKIAEAIVYYPAQFLKELQLTLIDTPGLGDDADMTQVTLQELEQCDIAVMLIMADSPFAMTEEEFLTKHLLNSRLGQIVFVVNGIDRLNNATEIEKVVNLVQTRVEGAVLKWANNQEGKQADIYLRKFGQPKVFALSAYQALQGKLKDDAELLKHSRFAEFEAVFTESINRERAGILLQAVTNTVLQQTGQFELALDKLNGKVKGRKQAFSTQIENLLAKTAEVKKTTKTLIADANSNIEKISPKLIKKIKKIYIKHLTHIVNTSTVSIAEFNASPTAFLSKFNNELDNSLPELNINFGEWDKIQSITETTLRDGYWRLQSLAEKIANELILFASLELFDAEDVKFYGDKADKLRSLFDYTPASFGEEFASRILEIGHPLGINVYLDVEDSNKTSRVILILGCIGISLGIISAIIINGDYVQFGDVMIGIWLGFSGAGGLSYLFIEKFSPQPKFYGKNAVSLFKENYIKQLTFVITEKISSFFETNNERYSELTNIENDLVEKIEGLLFFTKEKLGESSNSKDSILSCMQDLQKMQVETNKILTNTKKLSTQLMPIMGVIE
ncbi:dynamin family protein [Desulfococcaceae bacterium HSG7]|nr:dynamin family protein [Desulfococcaceae bacterium HSG7]